MMARLTVLNTILVIKITQPQGLQQVRFIFSIHSTLRSKKQNLRSFFLDMIRKAMHLSGICRRLATFLRAAIMANYLYGIFNILKIINLIHNIIPSAISNFTRLKLKTSRITSTMIPYLHPAMTLEIRYFGTQEKEKVQSILKRLIKQLFTLFSFLPPILITLQLVDLIQWSKFGIYETLPNLFFKSRNKVDK